MKVSIDTKSRTLDADGKTLDLYSDEAFRIVSDLWVNTGWNQKYPYCFSWLGVPVIQLPEDMIRYQEAVFALKPDVIIETGVAHGGSAIFSASLCRLIGKGRVIAIDIEIRPHNRKRIESHPLFDLITLIEASSTAPEVVEQVRAAIKPGDKVLVMLDSDHSYRHVMDELNAYAPLVSEGSWIVATDGVMQDLVDVPRGKPNWGDDNPAKAARDFAAANPDFVIEQPAWPFNESTLSENVTHWPDAWLRRVASKG
ncbi:cephalosporin hydroxylase family protein [Parvibaculum sp.]|uniref:cephalosporin hydroxylase family protein n=1 Tax=Parvibaculum sp. TaxID=2024848 RepID=UPI0027321913|nr:CmcI family methyltransferase [Parvibaculum sp.]MDP1627802.1 CmcI family methyltransferase [Parvibaculum sp.]MDP2150800.1 CmcI family methyltransferase [Parvibaculum sp.]MDP3327655.1 CmcI family methyltransferase [Parvibaculum sp.]